MKIEGGQFKITDLCDANGMVRGVEATGCTIVGPAVVVPLGSDFIGCSWDPGGGGVEAVVWEIDPVRTVIVGAVALEGCTFTRCQFVQVGFGGNSETVNKFFGGTTV